MIKQILSPEQADYLAEMINIGAGNAAAALDKILHNEVEVEMTAIHVVQPIDAFSIVDFPEKTVICVKMNIIGDCKGEIFFIVPQELKNNIVILAEKSANIIVNNGNNMDISVIEEIANILAGVYLTAINNFCGLNIYHTSPVAEYDMSESVLNKTIANMVASSEMLIIIASKFTPIRQNENNISAYLILLPYKNSEKVLLDSIEEAKKITGR